MTETDLDLSRAGWRKSTYSNNGGNCIEVAVLWRKSTHSNNGGECVEVAGVWRTSTHSNNGGSCVEVARGGPRLVAIRDSKDPAGPKLSFTPAQWQSFTRTVKA
jgi:Domain of unknown function (DUF397)